MMKYAPIVVFAYKRADHLGRCLATLRQNAEARFSALLVICDGARSDADQPAVEQVRKLVSCIDGFGSVLTVFREHNLGLGNSITSGVGSILEEHEQVIVLEDDLELSPYFLRYMNEALERYSREERVASIHGYCYPVDTQLPETFFLRGADCWGWATWRRAWSTFRTDGAALLSELRERSLTTAFDLDGAYPFTRMLEGQVAGRNDSWAVRWHASCFLNDLLTLYPGRSLVRNIGNDSSGTHSKSTVEYDVEVSGVEVRVEAIPIEPSEEARNAFISSLRPSVWRRVRRVGEMMHAHIQRGWR